jgi:hypothetical protein
VPREPLVTLVGSQDPNVADRLRFDLQGVIYCSLAAAVSGGPDSR